MLIQINHGTVFFGANDVFEDIDFTINENEKIALVGRNGSGKTTLLQVISGEIELTRGDLIRNSRLNIAYLKQNALINSQRTVREEMLDSFAPLLKKEAYLQELSQRLISDHSEKLIDEYTVLQEEFKQEGGYTYQSEMLTV